MLAAVHAGVGPRRPSPSHFGTPSTFEGDDRVNQQSSLQPDPWHRLRQLTPAHIALERAGASLPTRAQLDFQLSHALARDAVQQPFDPKQLERDLAPLN